MEHITLSVAGMSCIHCENAVRGAVAAINGVSSVQVSLKEKTVVVEYDGAKCSEVQIKAEIEEQGYQVVS